MRVRLIFCLFSLYVLVPLAFVAFMDFWLGLDLRHGFLVADLADFAWGGGAIFRLCEESAFLCVRFQV